MKSVFIKLRVIQTVDNNIRRKEGLARLGEGYSTAVRFNPLNPLSYLVSLVLFVAILFAYGFVGLKEKWSNPFLWE